jgi:hypothetical protein
MLTIVTFLGLGLRGLLGGGWGLRFLLSIGYSWVFGR